MRRATAWIVGVGVLALVAAAPSTAKAAGFWTTLAAGAAGSSSPSDYSEFWFDTPHGPPLAVTQFSGAGMVQATSGGGTTIFSPAGTPVLVPTNDGYATLSQFGVDGPAAGLPRFAGGAQASGAPQTAQPVPVDSNSLAANLGDPAGDGSRVLSVGVTDPNGTTIGNGSVIVPDGGWFVIGIGPGEQDGTSPPPDPDPIGGGGDDGGDPPVEEPPGPVIPPPANSVGGGNNGGAVTTPEPATAILVGLGGASMAGWRRLRRRK